MKKIKVLGTNCSKCKKLFKAVEKIITDNNLSAEVEKEEDIMKIMQYGVMSTPGLVIDDKVIFSGRVPDQKELLELIEKA